jgi:hypothetical protein
VKQLIVVIVSGAAVLAGLGWQATREHVDAPAPPVAEPAPAVAQHHHPAPDATDAAAAAELVSATKTATARYADYDVARVAGYRPNRNGGVDATHYPNPALMRDGRVLDPEVPESLMYWTAPDGQKVFVGVVFKAAPGEAAPAPGGALTMWHTHAAGKMCHPAEDAECPQDTGKMLHVFLFPGVQDPFAENMFAAAGGRQAFRQAMETEQTG